MRASVAVGTALLCMPSASIAQRARVSSADSALVRRILSAEDRRDANDVALKEGRESSNERIRVLAVRAIGRIGDPRFAARDSLAPLRPPMPWPEPAWRLRYHALTPQSDCGTIRGALADSTWQVRLRAADLAGQSCASDTSIRNILDQWIALVPADASQHARGGVAWQAAAHAIVALARVDPSDARRRLPALAEHRQWQLRMYAARAAGVLSDTARLRKLARDANDNVKERAIDALSALTGHGDDQIFLAVINSPSAGAQAVRAAARALLGSADPSAARRGERGVRPLGRARQRVGAGRARRAPRRGGAPGERRSAADDPAWICRPRGRAGIGGGHGGARARHDGAKSGGGSFVVRMRGDVAPIMVARVLALVQSGYYNGYGWHRVEPDFVIQGPSHGDNEYVGYSRYFRDELGPVPHARGTVGMSTRGHDTGDGQWFVNLRDNLRLGRDYSVFGEVVEGMDVVDGILEGDVIARIEEIR